MTWLNVTSLTQGQLLVHVLNEPTLRLPSGYSGSHGPSYIFLQNLGGVTCHVWNVARRYICTFHYLDTAVANRLL